MNAQRIVFYVFILAIAAATLTGWTYFVKQAQASIRANEAMETYFKNAEISRKKTDVSIQAMIKRESAK